MVVEVSRLIGGYGEQAIIKGVDLQLQPGEWLNLLGPNGSGKSTLLRLMSRLLKPQGGVVLLDGRDIFSRSPMATARRLAFLPQQSPLPSGLTVYQLISLGRSPYQSWWQWELDAEGRAKVEDALSWTQLESFRDRAVETLSGGERQRAFLALALAQNTKILLLDEPTTFLDLHHQLQLLELLKTLNLQRGLSIIASLHDVNLAARYGDRLAFLRKGELLAVGPPSETLTPATLGTVYDLQIEVIHTSVGAQIIPLAALSSQVPASVQTAT
ncbi:MAG: ABC transporter ATP-binding protein [Cyanobacteria bacterium P01_H01_bin.15]